MFFFFSSRRRHTRSDRDWSSDVCSSDLNWARSVIRSPGLRGESSEWAMPSTASLTSTSMCSPSSVPSQSAADSSGYRADRPARTLRTVAPGVSGSARTRRPVPSPPTNFVTQEATSTGIVVVASTRLISAPRGFTQQLAAGGEQPDQLGRRVGPRRVVDEALLATALDEPRATQDVEVVRERRPGDLELVLDLAGRHLTPLAHQEEEDLEPREVRERLERLDVVETRPEPGERERLHVFKCMELSPPRQVRRHGREAAVLRLSSPTCRARCRTARSGTRPACS